MGKKKFIDKKKAIKLKLMDNRSRYENDPEKDRVFVRIDNNPISLDIVNDDYFYADAPEGCEFDGNECGAESSGPLPEHVRKEILELGFPDDGYNYLIHLREVRNIESGSLYLPIKNKRRVRHLKDVKAYDASRLQINGACGDPNEKSVCNVASNTISLKGRMAVDPEVAALLDDSDISLFGSDVEEFEEDFVIQANIPLDGEAAGASNTLNLAEEPEGMDTANGEQVDSERKNGEVGRQEDHINENPRVQCSLDGQFHLIEHQEYGIHDGDGCYGDCVDEESQSLAEKLKHTLKGDMTDNLEFDDNYMVPENLLNDEENLESKELEIGVRQYAEYVEKYENEDEKGYLVVEESSDESRMWDCETMVSTYSNLDNHPGKIGTPVVARRKKIIEAVSGIYSGNKHAISLRGKERLTVDYVPHSKKPGTEKVEGLDNAKAGL